MGERNSNNQRSDFFNTNNSENRAAANNRSNGLNSNNSAYYKSRGN